MVGTASREGFTSVPDTTPLFYPLFYLPCQLQVGCLPFLAALSFTATRLVEQISKRANKTYEVAGGIAQQSISQIRTVAAYGAEGRALEQYDAALQEPHRLGVRSSLIQARRLRCSCALSACAIAGHQPCYTAP